MQNNTYSRIYIGINCLPSIMEKDTNIFLLKLYPNPAQSKITIDLETIKRNNVLFLSFYNSSGKIVKHINFHKPTKTIDIDISSLSPGLYFIRLQNETEVLGSGKFIKE